MTLLWNAGSHSKKTKEIFLLGCADLEGILHGIIETRMIMMITSLDRKLNIFKEIKQSVPERPLNK